MIGIGKEDPLDTSVTPEAAAAMTVAAHKIGKDEGYHEGHEKGYAKGYEDGRHDVEDLLNEMHVVHGQRSETIPELQARLFPGVVVPEAGPDALEMNPEIRTLWAAALLSGQYEKGKGRLHGFSDVYQVSGWCCLGVKCDLAVKAGVDVRVEHRDGRTWTYNGAEAFPPYIVRQWAGTLSDNPYVSGSLVRAAYPDWTHEGVSLPISYGSETLSLSSLNDSDANIPFSHIAYLILGRPDMINPDADPVVGAKAA